MSKALIVIPHDRFRDEEFSAVYEILKNSGVQVSIGSSHHTEAQGHFGLLVKPDVNVSFVEERDYDALIFIGGRGVEEYFDEPAVMNLVMAFKERSKVIGALGMAVEILIIAGILSGKRVTCDNSTIIKIQYAGAYYTGSLVEEDGMIITGTGIAAKEEFARTIVEALEYENRVKGYENAGTSRSRNYKK